MRPLRLRLIIPVIRAGGKPENTARAAVGLLCLHADVRYPDGADHLALVHSRKFFRKDFNVVIAMAWTWVTNFVTVPVCTCFFYWSGSSRPLERSFGL